LAILELKSISKNFKEVRALEDISMSVEKGSITVIIGPNGAGKSTMEKIIAGLYTQSSGAIVAFGKRFEKGEEYPPEIREKIGYVGENYALYDNLTVKANLEFFGALYGISKNEADAAAQSMLRELDAIEFFERKVGTLSRGTKQKVALCRALLNEPELLVLDEPTAFLDPYSAETLREKIEALMHANTAVVYATQRLEELGRLAGRVVLLNKGRIIAKGTLEELLDKIRGIRVEAVLLNTPNQEQKKALRKIGALVTGNRAIINVKSMKELPSIASSLVALGLKVATISYLDYDLGGMK